MLAGTALARPLQARYFVALLLMPLMLLMLPSLLQGSAIAALVMA